MYYIRHRDRLGVSFALCIWWRTLALGFCCATPIQSCYRNIRSFPRRLRFIHPVVLRGDRYFFWNRCHVWNAQGNCTGSCRSYFDRDVAVRSGVDIGARKASSSGLVVDHCLCTLSMLSKYRSWCASLGMTTISFRVKVSPFCAHGIGRKERSTHRGVLNLAGKRRLNISDGNNVPLKKSILSRFHV